MLFFRVSRQDCRCPFFELPEVVKICPEIFVFLCTMGTIKDTCFVCKRAVTPKNSSLNTVVNMPVCSQCKGTEREKKEEQDMLDSLADGFVCGCI